MNPIIKALQEELAKERDGLAEAYSYNQWAERKPEADDTFLNYKSGHEAANAFWLPLIEKALEIVEFYAKARYNGYQASAQEDGGKKAREFLTMLTDAKEEKKLNDLKKEAHDGK